MALNWLPIDACTLGTVTKDWTNWSVSPMNTKQTIPLMTLGSLTESSELTSQGTVADEQTSEQQEGQVSQDTSSEPSQVRVEEEATAPANAGTQATDGIRKRRREPDYLRVKNTPLKEGDRIFLTLEEKEVRVSTALSKQFICRVNGKDRFYFYEDRGVTWQHIQQSQ